MNARAVAYTSIITISAVLLLLLLLAAVVFADGVLRPADDEAPADETFFVASSGHRVTTICSTALTSDGSMHVVTGTTDANTHLVTQVVMVNGTDEYSWTMVEASEWLNACNSTLGARRHWNDISFDGNYVLIAVSCPPSHMRVQIWRLLGHTKDYAPVFTLNVGGETGAILEDVVATEKFSLLVVSLRNHSCANVDKRACDALAFYDQVTPVQWELDRVVEIAKPGFPPQLTGPFDLLFGVGGIGPLFDLEAEEHGLLFNTSNVMGA